MRPIKPYGSLNIPASAYLAPMDVIYVLHHPEMHDFGRTYWLGAGMYPVEKITSYPMEQYVVRRDLGKVESVYWVAEHYADGTRESGLAKLTDGRVLLYPWERWDVGLDSMKMRAQAERDNEIEEMSLF